MILVTGATGNVGGELVRALAGAGQPARALTRDDSPRKWPPGVQQAEARAEMSASMPAEYVDAFFDFYVTGTLDESQAQPDVRDVTGRAPRTFRQWAEAHAGAFRPS